VVLGVFWGIALVTNRLKDGQQGFTERFVFISKIQNCLGETSNFVLFLKSLTFTFRRHHELDYVLHIPRIMILEHIGTTVSLWHLSIDRTDKEIVRGFGILLLRLQVHIKYPKCCIVC
jgi:hypothetical protein